MPANGTVNLSIALTDKLEVSATRPTEASIPVNVTVNESYSAGTAANQINKVAYSSGTASAATVTLDFTALPCLNAETGFAAVRGVVVINDSTNPAHVLTVKPAATNGWVGPFGAATHTIAIDGSTSATKAKLILTRPGTTAGWTVSPTVKDFVLDPGANNIPYRVIVWGA